LYKTIAGKTLAHEDLNALLDSGKTSLLEGFTSKKGTPFAAFVCLDEKGKTSFEFVNDGSFHGDDSKYNCPLCHAQLKENKQAIFCVREKCSFTLFRQIASKILRAEDIKLLLTQGKTDLLQGFKSKKEQLFDAYIRLDENGRVAFEFPERTVPQEDSLQENHACPYCGMPMEKSAQWLACSRAECGYSLPLVFYGIQLPNSALQQLLQQKHSEVFTGFVKNDKTFKAALEIRADGNLGFDLATVELQ
jgi:DNA topoisomerase-3